MLIVQILMIIIGNCFQGRIQDLSEGGARLIKVQTNPDLGRKRRAADEIFFLT